MTETEIVGDRDVSWESGKWLSDDGRIMKLIHVQVQRRSLVLTMLNFMSFWDIILSDNCH